MKKFYAGVTINKNELTESNSNKIELEYYKISKRNKENKIKKVNLYGIEVVKKEYIGKKKIKEKTNICNLTNDENIINSLLNILKINKVTPISVEDIIEDVGVEILSNRK
jgi:hypothetical protein